MNDEEKNGGAAGATPPVEDGITPPAASAKKNEKMVEVPESLIETILKKQEDLEAGMKSRDEKIAQLEYAADKSRMGIYDSKNNKGELIRTYAVGIWNIADAKKGEAKEYLVRGTKLIYQDVSVEENGGVRRLVEKQTLRVYLDQGDDKDFKEIDIPYVDFYRNVQRKRFPVVKESKTSDGDFRTLRLEDGREVEFDIRFLNY